LLKAQNKDGYLVTGFGGGGAIYGHAIATLALSHAHAQTSGPLRDDIGKALERSLAYSLKTQRTAGVGKGGWRYMPFGNDADMSITGWQLLALAAVRETDRKVPAESIERALAFVKTTHDPRTGSYRYIPGYGQPTTACTAGAVLAFTLHTREGTHA